MKIKHSLLFSILAISFLCKTQDYEVFEYRSDISVPKEAKIPADGNWKFPAASVSALELNVT